jgi:hypothetical protein
MDSSVSELINTAVKNIIEHTGNDKMLKKLLSKHDKKVHFIPKRYRIFGGMLQSMNIQFGNFLEELMTLIIKNNPNFEIVDKYSGIKSNKFPLSSKNETLIDNYITACQTEGYEEFELDFKFLELMSKILADNSAETHSFKHDIDLLFKDKITGIYYYLEIKYNDDHDTGKFVDINRKFIKTAAYLIKELDIKELEKFKPIIFYFNNKKMKGNIYVPEKTNIYRGKRFFDEFLTVKYEDVEKYMLNLSENNETKKMFDDLYNKVINCSN